VGENKAKLVSCGVGSINGMVGLRPALVGLGVSECSLNDSTHGHTQHTQAIEHECEAMRGESRRCEAMRDE